MLSQKRLGSLIKRFFSLKKEDKIAIIKQAEELSINN